MLVLGEKYNFTSLELHRLQKKFQSISIITYNNKVQDDVLKELESALFEECFTLLVLNTKARVGNDIIKYLTHSQFKNHNTKLKIISIEHFMEQYLEKCYIPDDHTDLHFLEDIRPFSKWQYFQKRVIDYIGVFILFLLTSPIMLYTRYKIKKESPGTSMFKQLRVGKNGHEFKCIKFRSMDLDAEKDGAQFASENDTRVFSWGNFIRKTRFDELPQLLNILKGEMHLIGPRPERKIWTNEFEEQIPYYNERHLVLPGITGWAQVMYVYGSNADDAKQKLMYDLYYIKNWTFWLEIKIIHKTILVVLNKKGI